MPVELCFHFLIKYSQIIFFSKSVNDNFCWYFGNDGKYLNADCGNGIFTKIKLGAHYLVLKYEKQPKLTNLGYLAQKRSVRSSCNFCTT